MLSPDRLDRFARHIVLPDVGGAGQVALAQSHAVLVGLGGIGSPVLQYLAAAGVGRLTLIDDDTVSVSNLQRQTIYAEADIGRAKVEAATDWVRRFDPALTVTAHRQRLSRENAAGLFAGAGVVIDGSDTFATRLAVSDACVAAQVPLVSAALGRFQGQVGAFAGHRPDHACYRCFVGDAFDADDCDTCAEDGVLGAMAGWVGTLGTISALRVMLEGKAALGEPQWGQVHVMDGLAPSLRTMRIAKDPGCTSCRANGS